MLKLQAADLRKSYRGRKVVDDVNLEVQQGEVIGLLGPNGAGKTTTFYILVGLSRPDYGRVLLDGDLSYLAVTGCRNRIARWRPVRKRQPLAAYRFGGLENTLLQPGESGLMSMIGSVDIICTGGDL